MAKQPFIETWLQAEIPSGAPKNVVVLTERPQQRAVVKAAIRDVVVDHLIGAEIVESIGDFAKAATVIRNALPVSKRTRSGDLGEILATEYIAQSTPYEVPVRRLRFKDDREVAMRGDDVLGFEFAAKPVRILKTESKSRASLGAAVAKEACGGLCRHSGRPNPSTLSFISRRLREQARHEVALILEQLQDADIPITSVGHLIFTLSGNSPTTALSAVATSPIEGIDRQLVGCVITDHASFINSIFDGIMKEGAPDGDN